MYSKEITGKQRGKTLSRDVAEVLTRRIATGQYALGSKMPTERLLSIEFGVNRHAVREALKRLEAIGLIRIKHGSGIYVERIHFTAGVDIFDMLLFNDDHSVNYAFLKDLLEFRRLMLLTIVELAVQRRKARELGRICRLIDDLCFARQKGEELAQEEIALDIFEAIAKATHNEIYVLVFNTLSLIFKQLRNLFEIPYFGIRGDLSILNKFRDAFEFANASTALAVLTDYLDAVDEKVLPKNEQETSPDVM